MAAIIQRTGELLMVRAVVPRREPHLRSRLHQPGSDASKVPTLSRPHLFAGD